MSSFSISDQISPGTCSHTQNFIINFILHLTVKKNCTDLQQFGGPLINISAIARIWVRGKVRLIPNIVSGKSQVSEDNTISWVSGGGGIWGARSPRTSSPLAIARHILIIV